MATQGAPSAQQGQKPEAVTPLARADETAELGAEGGSYGELTQGERAHREWGGGAAERQATWRLAPAALLALVLAIAVILAMMFWATGS
jgi:hypothetical protein